MTMPEIPDEMKTAQVDPTHAATVLSSIIGALSGTQLPGATNPGGTNFNPIASTPSSLTVPGPANSQPVAGNFPVTQAFGQNGEGGIDLGTPPGTPVLAMFPGTVKFAGPDEGFGHMVIIDHGNGIETVYGHLQGDFQVHTGDTVKAGQQLDTVGAGIQGHSSGPHLEVQVQINGQKVNPAPYLAGGSPAIGTPASGENASAAPLSPDAILGAQITNVGQALAGQTPTHSATGSTSATGTASTIQSGTRGSDADPNALNAFLAATRQHESGGNYTIYNQSGQSDASGAYQFLSTTWKSMGGSTATAAQATPAEQDAIAAKMAQQLFDKYHSWRLVAIAWYGGPGVADQVAAGKDPGSPSGQGGYLAYGDTIQRMMGGG